jgi:hypothetical protein
MYLFFCSLFLRQVIYDLLEKSSGHLELREDPQHGIVVAGLRSIKVCVALSLAFEII